MPPSPAEIVLRLALALALGMAVGIDREITGKPAGMRTLMLVALGAATFVLIPILSLGGDAAPARENTSRVIQGIVGGIGFLGAGVVIHSGLKVAGITTAAAIWVTAALGVAVGLGHYTLAFAAGVGTVFTLAVVGRLEHRLVHRFGANTPAGDANPGDLPHDAKRDG